VVELSSWLETIKKHPLEFKFRGLSGFHKDVRVACTQDERFMDKYIEVERKYKLEDLGQSVLGNPCDYEDTIDLYANWLVRAYSNLYQGNENPHKLVHSILALRPSPERQWSLQLLCQGIENEFSPGQPWRVEELRNEFLEATGEIEPQHMWNCILGDDQEPYLNKYPPEAIKSHASGDSVDIEKVFFLCPSCGNEPVTEEDCGIEEKDGVISGHFYCGLCGAEVIGSRTEFVKNLEDLGVEIYPFSIKNRTSWQERVAPKVGSSVGDQTTT
jgi:predicted RNA-binding Zn-ribbon protein involved in translation (DUF1610 family)